MPGCCGPASGADCDVLTTGATADESSRTLLMAGARERSASGAWREPRINNHCTVISEKWPATDSLPGAIIRGAGCDTM